MSIKKLFLCQFLFLVIIGCQQSSYHIDGHVTGMKNGSYIMLFKFSGDTIYSVDTTAIQNNHFSFEGPEFLDDIAILTAGNYPERVKATEIILDRGNIKVDLDSQTWVTGSPLNEKYNIYRKKLAEYKAVSDTLIKHGVDPEKHHDDQNLLMAYSNTLKYKLSTIEREIENPMGLRLFKNEIENNNIDDSLFEVILGKVPTKFISDQVITEAIKYKREIKENNEAKSLLAGKNYIDFNLITPENKAVKLSDYVGHSKFTIIEFWASWCAPCIREVPNLNNIYSKYRNKGLQIISISVDKNMHDWQKIIRKVDAPWIHLSDLKGIPSELTKTYAVKGIPHILLIDEKGIIIEPHSHLSFLEKIFEQVLESTTTVKVTGSS